MANMMAGWSVVAPLTMSSRFMAGLPPMAASLHMAPHGRAASTARATRMVQQVDDNCICGRKILVGVIVCMVEIIWL